MKSKVQQQDLPPINKDLIIWKVNSVFIWKKKKTGRNSVSFKKKIGTSWVQKNMGIYSTLFFVLTDITDQYSSSNFIPAK